MNANDILIDLLEDNRRRVHRLFDSMSEECRIWKPEADANNITVTVWHMGRIFDVFLNVQAKGCSPVEECWFRHGWAEQTGYDPRGIGLDGWGMLTGYSQEEAAGIPPLTRNQVLGYLDDVYDTVKEYIQNTPLETMIMPAKGFEGRYSQYQCIQMALLDNVRHLGEIMAIKARWDRKIRIS